MVHPCCEYPLQSCVSYLALYDLVSFIYFLKLYLLSWYNSIYFCRDVCNVQSKHVHYIFLLLTKLSIYLLWIVILEHFTTSPLYFPLVITIYVDFHSLQFFENIYLILESDTVVYHFTLRHAPVIWLLALQFTDTLQNSLIVQHFLSCSISIHPERNILFFVIYCCTTVYRFGHLSEPFIIWMNSSQPLMPGLRLDAYQIMVIFFPSIIIVSSSLCFYYLQRLLVLLVDLVNHVTL